MGGQATNSGIDYQQRIASWCLVNQYLEFDMSTYFDQIEEELIIDKIHFETNQPIDDLNILCKSGKTVFLQIKRSLSLSLNDSSDFYKTINQFVKEFIKSEKKQCYFGLITTSDASGKITNDLKKILNSVKLSINGFNDNPLNESEKDTLNKFELLFIELYKNEKGQKPDDSKFKLFAKKIFIAMIDVEAGNTVEIASFMLLKSIGFKKPELIWALLIRNSLVYASGRLSIDRHKLDQIFSRYLVDEKNKSFSENDIDFLKTEIISEGEYSTNKEVLFIESLTPNFDYMILELYRFNSECKIKNSFYGNKVKGASGNEWTVIQRFATMSGLSRYMEEKQTLYKEKRVAIIPLNDNNNEQLECIELHKAYLEELINKNDNPLICLHCGKSTIEKNAILVEIEDMESTPAVGIVHKTCLRPIDRILGTIKIPIKHNDTYLDFFDYKLWVSLMMKGQGLLNALKSSPNLTSGRTPIISWNSKEEYDADYSHCIKLNLKDGSTSYVYKRNKIERLNMRQAEEHLKLFNTVFQKYKDLNDPLCVLSKSKSAASYSEILKIKEPDDVILEVVSAEITKYSKLVAKLFDRDLFYYAPLCLVRDHESESILNLSNVVPLISDPLQFESFIDNWRQLGFKIDEVELKIIKSDKDFDNNIRMIFEDGMVPILDPLFDKNFNLVSGYQINDFNKMIETAEKNHSEE